MAQGQQKGQQSPRVTSSPSGRGHFENMLSMVRQRARQGNWTVSSPELSEGLCEVGEGRGKGTGGDENVPQLTVRERGAGNKGGSFS